MTACLYLLLAPRPARAQGQTPSELIKFLAYQSDRPDKFAWEAGLFTCGQVEANRQAASSLVKFGSAALPDIESALDSIESLGEDSELNAGLMWVLDAYATIKGPGAYPRLVRMMDNPKLLTFRVLMENATAVSLGLTSYVVGDRVPGRIFRCRVEEPRDGLDEFILALERDDQLWLAEHLGPVATRALDALLKAGTWTNIREGLGPNRRAEYSAVGYRFDIPGRWSQPNDTLSDRVLDASLDNPLIPTRFSDRAGKECGSQLIQFRRGEISLPGNVRYPGYLVDSSDLESLLRLVAGCATKGTAEAVR